MARVIFMGTPAFAVPILCALHDTQEVVGVFTQPDRPAGRGRQVALSPIKQAALAHRLPVFQPKTLRSAKVQAELRSLRPDLIVVAAYGLILPQAVLDGPPKGCLNVHASLLPKYRGASPIAFAILAGENQTGVSIMLMDAGLDTGPILSQLAIPVEADDTAGSLEDKLSALAAELLAQTLPSWLNGALTPQLQNDQAASLTRLLSKADGLIDWTQPAAEIVRRIRAFNPWPGAYTFWHAQPLKLLRAATMTNAHEPGHVFGHAGAVLVGAGEGSVGVVQVQPAGKRAMSAAEFVRGHADFIGSGLGR